jgi:ATP-dependent helicase HrpB
MSKVLLPELPVTVVLADLATALERGNKAVLVAPPGAGKTTMVPLSLLDAGWREDGTIVLLEPRRLAARAAARRMASLLGEEPGGVVGYAMRMEKRVSERTRILVVTEGVLARMILDDPELPGIKAVIFDEFHERSLDGDFGLALALDVQGALRPDLRLLVMSATLDGARVAKLLDGAPVIESEGRAFPVDIRYRERPAGTPVEDAMAAAIRAALSDAGGSVLAFLPGQREIARTAERLEGRVAADTDIVRLYGMMDAKAQDAAIRPPVAGRRKVVLATAIAETSITIDGVRVVIDSGLARLPAYEPSSGLTRLETVRVSRASADQRAGRAGRTEPGVAIRLWPSRRRRCPPSRRPKSSPPTSPACCWTVRPSALPIPQALPSSTRRPALRSTRRAIFCARWTPSMAMAALPIPARRCGASPCRCGLRIWWPRLPEMGMSGTRPFSPCF